MAVRPFCPLAICKGSLMQPSSPRASLTIWAKQPQRCRPRPCNSFWPATINGHRVSGQVVFIAATNRRTDRAGVSGILEPVKSRFATLVELTADINDWCVWAVGAGIAPEVIAFLRFRPELLCAFDPTSDLTNSPLPRTWHQVSKILSLDLPRDCRSP